MPSAKLLSKNEQTVDSESPLVGAAQKNGRTIVNLLLAGSFGLLAACLFQFLGFSKLSSAFPNRTVVARPFHLRVELSLSALFFRPPPAIL